MRSGRNRGDSDRGSDRPMPSDTQSSGFRSLVEQIQERDRDAAPPREPRREPMRPRTVRNGAPVAEEAVGKAAESGRRRTAGEPEPVAPLLIRRWL